jgi:hypothetical protein
MLVLPPIGFETHRLRDSSVVPRSSRAQVLLLETGTTVAVSSSASGGDQVDQQCTSTLSPGTQGAAAVTGSGRTQNLTDADLAAGQVRIPRESKPLFPDGSVKSGLNWVANCTRLRGTRAKAKTKSGQVSSASDERCSRGTCLPVGRGPSRIRAATIESYERTTTAARGPLLTAAPIARRGCGWKLSRLPFCVVYRYSEVRQPRRMRFSWAKPVGPTIS